MADKKISQLTALSAVNLAPSTDVLAIVDTSATETKKIVAQDLINGVLNVASAVGIGTASPSYKLDVAGDARSNSWIGRANGSAPTADCAVFRPADNSLGFSTANTLRATIDSSGNLGLGVTPSAWVNATASQVGYGAAISSRSAGNTASDMTHAAYWNGTNWLYQSSSVGAARYQMTGANAGSTHAWFVSAGGTAGNTISFTQAMTLDASGNLGVGTTSPATKLHVYSGSGATSLKVQRTTVPTYLTDCATGASNAASVWSVNIQNTSNGSSSWASPDNSVYSCAAVTLDAPTAGSNILFSTASAVNTAPTERARITSGGYFKASNAGTYESSTGSYHEARQSASGERVLDVAHTHASNPYGMQVKFTAASPDNNTNWFFVAQDSTTTRCYIWSDGDLANHDGVYGTISDERLKQDIVDASSQWDDLKSIRFRKYRMKTDVEANPDAPAMFGVVAQELAQVCPGLVDEHPNMKTVEVTDEEGNVTQTQEPDGTTTMTVKSSILLMKAAKALQEAMARIESLEADMAALKGAK